MINEESWTREYEAWRHQPPPRRPTAGSTRYKHSAIKSALKQESHGKCIYCESRVTHIYPGDCEHLLPKSARPELVVDWDNLGFVCFVCNHEKGDYYSAATPLVNPLPRTDDFLVWAGPFCAPKDPGPRAAVTLSALALDRTDLVVERTEAMKRVEQLIQQFESTDNPDIKFAARSEALRAARPTEPYSAAIRDYLRWRTDWEVA